MPRYRYETPFPQIPEGLGDLYIEKLRERGHPKIVVEWEVVTLGELIELIEDLNTTLRAYDLPPIAASEVHRRPITRSGRRTRGG